MSNKQITGIVKDAEITEDRRGLQLMIESNGRIFKVISTIDDPWLRVPKGKDPVEELQKVCSLLKGIEIVDGAPTPIPGFTPRQITIQEGC